MVERSPLKMSAPGKLPAAKSCIVGSHVGLYANKSSSISMALSVVGATSKN
jgi:hypothetical protein